MCFEARIILELLLRFREPLPLQRNAYPRLQRQLDCITAEVRRTIQPVVVPQRDCVFQPGVRDRCEIRGRDHTCMVQDDRGMAMMHHAVGSAWSASNYPSQRN